VVALGGITSFTVGTSGTAPIGYQWLRNGVAIAGATGSAYSPPAAQAMDGAAVLRVIVRTSAGNIESAPAVMTVPGSGLRMVAGAYQKSRTFDPIFDSAMAVSAITADGAGNVYAKTNNVLQISAAGAVTSLGTHTCSLGSGMALDKSGSIYFACGVAIFKKTGTAAATPFAGQFFGNADGVGTLARFSEISAVASNANGILFVADRGNGTIRRIALDGTVTTVAGSARNGTAVDGAAAVAKFIDMRGIAVDAEENIYVTDRSSIRKVSSTGMVTTLAGNPVATAPGSADGIGAAAQFNIPWGIALGADGQLYIVDSANHNIRKMSPSGSVTTLAGRPDQFGSIDGFGAYASFNQPRAITVDASGNLIVFDYGNGNLRKVTPLGSVSTLTGTPVTQNSSGSINGYGQEARFKSPVGLSLDENGNLFVADSLGHSVRKITPAGLVSTVAGSSLVNGVADGVGALASFRQPQLVAAAGNGVVYVFDALSDPTFDVIRRVGPDGAVTTVKVPADPANIAAGGSEAMEHNQLLAADLNGNYYLRTENNLGAYLRRIAPDGSSFTIVNRDTPYPGTGKTVGQMFFAIRAMAIDHNGTIYLSDPNNNTVLKVSNAGVVSLFAGAVGLYAQVDGAGADARFSFPWEIAVDPAGNVYVVDGDSSLVRKITPAGMVSTLAGTSRQYGDGTGPLPGTLSAVKGIAADASGNVYLSQENGLVKIVQP
jgi:hypothetical protein